MLNDETKIDKTDFKEYTALHQAAAFEQKTVMELLLKHGADINENNQEGSAALYFAARSGHETVVAKMVSPQSHIN